MKRLVNSVFLIMFSLSLSSCSFTETIEKVEALFVNSDDSIIFRNLYKKGETPYCSITPEYPFSDMPGPKYSFVGWEPEIKPIYDNTVFKACYKKEDTKYKITWNVDGNVRNEFYDYGTTPTYKYGTPTKQHDVQSNYYFAGWQPEITEVTCDATYVAQFSSEAREYTITWKNENEILETQSFPYGSIPSYGGKTPAKEKTAQYSYVFSNWNPKIDIVTSNQTYNAVFDKITNFYRVTFDSNGGLNECKDYVTTYGGLVNLPNPVFEGHVFLGWYDGDVRIDGNYFNFTYDHDLTLVAHWNEIYNIGYHLNGGTVENANPTTYTIDDSFDLHPASKKGYTFLGWKFENQYINRIEKGTCQNMVLEAIFEINQYSVNVEINDNTKGTVIGNGAYNYGDVVTLSANAKEGYVFGGWYIDDYSRISTKTNYVFTLLDSDFTIHAVFMTPEEFEEADFNIKHGVVPNFDIDKKTVTYGLYPQSVVDDPDLRLQLYSNIAPNDGEEYEYEKCYSNTFEEASFPSTRYLWYKTFHNGEDLIPNYYYFFKYEPIKWYVVECNDGTYVLYSSILVMPYIYNYASDKTYLWPASYDNSVVRKVINDSFYNKAFSKNNTFIQSLHFDNVPNGDKVYLPSYDEIKNKNKYITEFDVPDYARIIGGSNNYWTRTRVPLENIDSRRNLVWYCASNYLYHGGVDNWYSIRPLIQIRVDA